MSDSITGLSSKNYSDVYDSKAGSLTNKLTDTDYSKASDDELMSVCKDFESYFVEQVLKSMKKMRKILILLMRMTALHQMMILMMLLYLMRKTETLRLKSR